MPNINIHIHPRDEARVCALLLDGHTSAQMGDDAHSEACVEEATTLLRGILEGDLTLGDFDNRAGLGSWPVLWGRDEVARISVDPDGRLAITH